jgi:DNA-binding XRE family transcriptional regulator
VCSHATVGRAAVGTPEIRTIEHGLVAVRRTLVTHASRPSSLLTNEQQWSHAEPASRLQSQGRLRTGARIVLLIGGRRIGITGASVASVPRSPGERLELIALGRAVRELRHERGISQEDLADEAGLHRTYVGGIDRGERNVAFLNLVKLAGALGVPASELLSRYERIRDRAGRT